MVCSLCWKELGNKEQELYRLKRCTHVFHKECMEKYISFCIEKKQESCCCPMCRTLIKTFSLRYIGCQHQLCFEIINVPIFYDVVNIYNNYLDIYGPNIYWDFCNDDGYITSVDLLFKIKYIYEKKINPLGDDFCYLELNNKLVEIFNKIMEQGLDLDCILLYFSMENVNESYIPLLLQLTKSVNEFVIDPKLVQEFNDSLPKYMFPCSIAERCNAAEGGIEK